MFSDALSILELKLVGPFHYLSNKKNKEDCERDPSYYHMRWRYFYDVPEFLTVIVSTEKDNSFHVGYFRDHPDDLESVVVASNTGKNASLKVLGDNIFSALRFVIFVLVFLSHDGVHMVICLYQINPIYIQYHYFNSPLKG